MDLESKISLKIEGNMYTNYQFETYLNKHAKKFNAEGYANGPYKDKIIPQLKKGVISSLLACRDSCVSNGKNLQHEVFGYDFMVDTNLNVWLIEVNSSPSMEYSSVITERMCKEVLFNLTDIAMEQEKCLENSAGAEEF